MVGEWCDITLGDFVALQRGHDLTESERRNGRVPVMGSAGQNGYHDTALAKGPGIVIGRSGASFGQVHFSKKDFWPHNTGLYVTDFKGNDPLFAYYFLKALDFDRFNSGSAQPSLNRNFIYPIPIRVPKPIEQKAIAVVLGALDDKIELNRRMNSTLEAMARALFQSWFVDFDPVRAKTDGRQPEGMAAETAALFPDALEHTADGSLLPRGWLKTNLGKEVQFLTGFTFKSEFFTDSPPGVRVARGMNVKEGEFFWGSQARYWPEITPELEQYRLQSGDVLIGMDGSKVGKNWVRVRASDLPCLLVQRVARLRPACSIGENFIWIAVGSPTFRYYVDAVKTGTSIPHISGGQIKSFEFVRPPKNDNRIFKCFESLVAPLSAQMDKNHAELETLVALRDALLPKLLSGELSVTETH
ncbi:MAG: restriction endonuclease subunit S [Salinivirgaceae bacterium]|nr:restriction endonuclease subunit S [Salinivirgaceae bacterium]